MKGPFQRLKYDSRRLWECPVCGHRAYSPGSVTSHVCRCQQQAEPGTQRFMRLVEESSQPRQPPAGQPDDEASD